MAKKRKSTKERLAEIVEHGAQAATTVLAAPVEEGVGVVIAGKSMVEAGGSALKGEWDEAARHATEAAVAAASPITKGATSAVALGYNAVGLAAHATGLAEIPTANDVTNSAANYMGEAIGDTASEKAAEGLDPNYVASRLQHSPMERLSPEAREGAYVLDVRSFLPFAQVGGGFDGDNRGFSPEREASSRLHYSVVLRPQRGDYLESEVLPGQTFGPIGGFGPRVEGQAKPTAEITSYPIKDGTRYEIHIAGANPNIPLSPDIDVYASISVTHPMPGFTKVATHFKGDAFPAMEATLTHENGRQLFVGAYMPPGSQLVNLFGDGQRSMGTFSGALRSDFSRILSADFTSPMANRVGNTHDRGTFTPEGWAKTLLNAATPEGMPKAHKIYDALTAEKEKSTSKDARLAKDRPQPKNLQTDEAAKKAAARDSGGFGRER